jgi:hypothetical protein|tara:strand:- start:118 stop:414 length:297 start_codon:yes stop_codon:yes gene_type:complete
MLIFKDSDRESILSYFDDDALKIGGEAMIQDGFFKKALIDTPTRLVNHSNEFLPQKKNINPDKLAKKGNLLLKNNIKHFRDLEGFSDIEKSQKSTARK